MLLVVPGAGDVEVAAQRLAGLGIAAYDARQRLLRGVPFALGCDVERARGTAVELRGAGVEAFAVDEEVLARSPPLLVVRSFNLFPEGIEITTRPTAAVPAATHAVRWSHIELIAAARAVQSTVVHTETTRRKMTANPVKMMRKKTQVDRQHEQSDERFTLVLAREPDVLMRFDLEGLDYTGLAERRQPVARGNYDALVALVRASAPQAAVDDRLEKLAARLAGAPAASSLSAQSRGRVKTVTQSFSDDNEGAVVAAARLLCLAQRLRAPAQGRAAPER